MSKKGICIIIILIGIICSVTFITVDCVRLKNSNRYTKPIITISEKNIMKNGIQDVTYYGLGYSVRYYTGSSIDGNIVHVYGYGTKIFLFNIIPIWAIEAN